MQIVISITSKLKRKLEMFTNVNDLIIIRADCVLDTFPFLTLFKLQNVNIVYRTFCPGAVMCFKMHGENISLLIRTSFYINK